MNSKVLYTLALVVPFGLVVLAAAYMARNFWATHRDHFGPVIPI
jgi:hypothetical protein